MKTAASALITVLIVASMLAAASKTLANSTKRVPSDYPTIQEAIDAAAPGDVIQVSGQTYYENIIVNKSVWLIGENPETTIIDGSKAGTVIYVYADNVKISGFTIRNSGIGKLEFYSGVHMNLSTNIEIVRNIISNNEFGLLLEDARNNVINDNAISHSERDAIYLGNSTSSTISTNIMTNSTYGVWLERSSSYNVIRGNTITNSSKGIRLAGNSNNNAVYDNTLQDNDDGIDLSSSFNTICENTLKRNSYGIYSASSKETGNTIYRNNFISNTIQASILTKSLVQAWDNGVEGNYWSDYTGEDLNGDGIGDTNVPHREFDWHPLVEPWSALRVFNVILNGEDYVVTTLSNSTIASFSFNQSLQQMSFNVTGSSTSLGFCNVTIPKLLLKSEPPKDWTVTVDGVNVLYTLTENSTHTSLHFIYSQSTSMVRIRVMLVENYYPIPDFTYLPTSPKIYETINFTDLSTDSDGNIVSWYWEFGDGNNSTEQNPRYAYVNADQYIVTLTVEDDFGARTASFKVLSVRKLGTVLSVYAPSTASQGETLNVSVTLKDENEKAVSNAAITFSMNEQGEWKSLGSSETNAIGVALISYAAPLAGGTYKFKAEFEGTQTLSESSILFTIEIMDATWTLFGLPWWLIAVCLALVIATFVSAFFILKKMRLSVSKRKSAP